MASGGSSESTVVSKINNNNIEEVSDESELELGLGLSIAAGCTTDKHKHTDLPSPPSSSSSSSSSTTTTSLALKSSSSTVVGTERAASPTSLSQVVGWPPIRVSRMNSMANQAKSVANGGNNFESYDIKRKDMIYGTNEKGNAKSKEKVPGKSSLFVKVNMDGAAIGRKVDLNAHPSYESLARTLEDMFTNRTVENSSGEELILMPKVTRPSKFLDGSSDYVLTYEDKDGDWMLVGDVPWSMFLSSVKRLRIMRTSEANGLAPRSEERSAKQRSRPI